MRLLLSTLVDEGEVVGEEGVTGGIELDGVDGAEKFGEGERVATDARHCVGDDEPVAHFVAIAVDWR